MNDLISKDIEKTYVFLETGETKYIMSSKHILEIIKLPNLDCPNTLPRYVQGLLEYRGEILNVMDLRSLLGLEVKEFPLSSKIVIIDFEENKFALIVDNVSDIKKVESSFIKNAPYDSEAEIIQKIYTPENEPCIMVLNVRAIASILKKSLEHQIFCESRYNLMPNDKNSLEILKQRSLNLKKKTEITPYSLANEENQYTTFQIDETVYCIKTEYIKEFFKLNKTKITPVPCTPSFIKGIMNVRGNYVCVIDIKDYLERGETEICEKSTLIILEYKDIKIGILTNGIGQSAILQNIVFSEDKEICDYVQEEVVYCVLNICVMLKNEKIYVK